MWPEFNGAEKADMNSCASPCPESSVVSTAWRLQLYSWTSPPGMSPEEACAKQQIAHASATRPCKSLLCRKEVDTERKGGSCSSFVTDQKHASNCKMLLPVEGWNLHNFPTWAHNIWSCVRRWERPGCYDDCARIWVWNVLRYDTDGGGWLYWDMLAWKIK